MISRPHTYFDVLLEDWSQEVFGLWVPWVPWVMSSKKEQANEMNVGVPAWNCVAWAKEEVRADYPSWPQFTIL